jgi:hypothetical protein
MHFKKLNKEEKILIMSAVIPIPVNRKVVMTTERNRKNILYYYSCIVYIEIKRVAIAFDDLLEL